MTSSGVQQLRASATGSAKCLLVTGLDGVSKSGRALSVRMAPRLEDAAVLDHVLAELREIDRCAGIERTLAIGELILNRFFGGDPAAWRR